jgi:hypothetical protein
MSEREIAGRDAAGAAAKALDDADAASKRLMQAEIEKNPAVSAAHFWA